VNEVEPEREGREGEGRGWNGCKLYYIHMYVCTYILVHKHVSSLNSEPLRQQSAAIVWYIRPLAGDLCEEALASTTLLASPPEAVMHAV